MGLTFVILNEISTAIGLIAMKFHTTFDLLSSSLYFFNYLFYEQNAAKNKWHSLWPQLLISKCQHAKLRWHTCWICKHFHCCMLALAFNSKRSYAASFRLLFIVVTTCNHCRQTISLLTKGSTPKLVLLILFKFLTKFLDQQQLRCTHNDTISYQKGWLAYF